MKKIKLKKKKVAQVENKGNKAEIFGIYFRDMILCKKRNKIIEEIINVYLNNNIQREKD
jgi:hypothetical protein